MSVQMDLLYVSVQCTSYNSQKEVELLAKAETAVKHVHTTILRSFVSCTARAMKLYVDFMSIILLFDVV